jgi:hypothetical protein
LVNAFAALSPITPSGNASINKTSNLGTTLNPVFEGGILTVDQDKATYTQDFTLPQDGTIDGADNDANFTGSFSGTGTLTITNSGTDPKIVSEIELGSTSNPISLGGITLARGSSQLAQQVRLRGEGTISGDTRINFGSLILHNNFSSNNLSVSQGVASFDPTSTSQKLIARNALSVNDGGAFVTSVGSSIANSEAGATIQLKAGSIDSSQNSSIVFRAPTTIETERSSFINGSFTGGSTLADFDEVGSLSKPITWKGTGETTFSPSSAVIFRSETNANRPLLAPDFVVQGKIRIDTDNFKLRRYTVKPFAIDSANGNFVIDPTGEVSGTGTISANVWNEGTVSPGNSIGTLTIDGDYIQGITNPNANLNIEVNGSSSDLLTIIGDNRTILLGGNLTIGSLSGTQITPNQVYTAIDVTGQGAFGGELNLKTDLSGVVGSSGYLFARETSPAFARIDQSYYDTCTSSDPNIQKNCTKLQFAWLQIAKDPNSSKGTKQVTTPTGTVAVVASAKTKSPTTVMKQVKQTVVQSPPPAPATPRPTSTPVPLIRATQPLVSSRISQAQGREAAAATTPKSPKSLTPAKPPSVSLSPAAAQVALRSSLMASTAATQPSKPKKQRSHPTLSPFTTPSSPSPTASSSTRRSTPSPLSPTPPCNRWPWKHWSSSAPILSRSPLGSAFPSSWKSKPARQLSNQIKQQTNLSCRQTTASPSHAESSHPGRC